MLKELKREQICNHNRKNKKNIIGIIKNIRQKSVRLYNVKQTRNTLLNCPNGQFLK